MSHGYGSVSSSSVHIVRCETEPLHTQISELVDAAEVLCLRIICQTASCCVEAFPLGPKERGKTKTATLNHG